VVQSHQAGRFSAMAALVMMRDMSSTKADNASPSPLQRPLDGALQDFF